MSVLDELEWLRRGRSEDDSTVILEPGLDVAPVEAIERRLGAPLPSDLRTRLGACHGVRGLAWEIGFAGTSGFEMDNVFPHGPPIAGDRTGNFWVVGCLTRPEAEAAVFFACHDPPVMLWQCRGMKTFLRELRRTFVLRERSSLDQMHDEGVLRVCVCPTGLRRYGEERPFARAAPKRRTGILSRLFGR